MKKNLTIKPGCITCGACEFIAPEVFQVTDICHVLPNIDTALHESVIECAVQACPVNVIEYGDIKDLKKQ